MKSEKQLKKFLDAVAMLAVLAVPVSSAHADTLKYLGPAYGGYVGTSGLVYTSPAVTASPSAGGILMQNVTAGGSFAAWCVDIYSWLNTSASGSNYTLTSGTAFYLGSPDKVTALERLASQHLASLSTVSDSGAFQLAVWEIAYETGASYNLGTGAFQVGSATGGAIATANNWLAALGNSAPTMALSVWASGSSQDLAVFAAPVPESEIYAMMIAGLGLLGFVARRRNRGVAV
jgi:hypothetical protein